MSETINTPQENKSEERKSPREPLTSEIIRKFFNDGDTVKYIDVVTDHGYPLRITRHPTDKFLLKITCQHFTADLDPLNPVISGKLFILDETLARIDRDSTDEGIERIKHGVRSHKELLYTCG